MLRIFVKLKFSFLPNVDEEDSTIRINIISVSSYFYP